MERNAFPLAIINTSQTADWFQTLANIFIYFSISAKPYGSFMGIHVVNAFFVKAATRKEWK
jgi:hypothetical protein